MEIPDAGEYCGFKMRTGTFKQVWILILQAVLPIYATTVSEAQVWEKERNEDDIAVFNRMIPGSDFKEFRAEAVYYTTSMDEQVPDRIAR